MATSDFSELNRLAIDLGKAAGGQVGARAARAVRKTAFDIEATAKVFCPVDTGNLRNSISTDIVGDGRFGSVAAEIGPTASYAPFVELGTSRMAPQAFMGPAFDRHAHEFVTAIEEIAGKML